MALTFESFGFWEPHLNMLQLWDVNLGRRIQADARVHSIEGVPVSFREGGNPSRGSSASAEKRNK